MTADDALHVVCGGSAAGSLKAALGLSTDQLLVNQDPLAVGPAPAVHDPSAWSEVRRTFLKEMCVEWPCASFDEYVDRALLNGAQVWEQAARVVIWAAPSLGDQLLVARLCSLFRQSRVQAANPYVVQLRSVEQGHPIRSLGELSPESIRRLAPKPKVLSERMVGEYALAWQTYTSREPADLVRFLKRRSLPGRIRCAMDELVYRYPAVNSGLSRADEALLEYTESRGPKVSRIVGHALAFSGDLDPPGDQYLFHRLRRLGRADLRYPLVSLAGDCTAMRGCEARLTDFGRAVLAGEADALDGNGIDDWIGGVHLEDPASSPRRDGDRLLLPAG